MVANPAVASHGTTHRGPRSKSQTPPVGPKAASTSSYNRTVAEYSPAERLPARVELTPEEMALLLGPDRFESHAPEPPASIAPAAPIEPAAPADAIEPPSGAPRPLGDADLVDAILSGAPNMTELLLRVLRERTGEPLARLVDGAVADAMIAAGTGTRVDDSRALVAPMPSDVRVAWASWLSRWLRLANLVATRASKGGWDDPTGLPMWHRARAQAAQRIATCRMRHEPVHIAVLRLEDTDLWNRRSQVLVNDALQARAAAELDQHVGPGDELSRLEDGTFVLVSTRSDATDRLATALRAMIALLPADGPRSLVLYTGVAIAPWDATCPQALLDTALRRAAEQRR